MDVRRPFIGTAGWAIRSEHRALFPSDGSHLERYAARFDAVEINSSFYRPHRKATYERWAGAVGDGFSFSVKLPKTISHGGLASPNVDVIKRFAEEVSGLGKKLGVILVQFPPSLAFDPVAATSFFEAISARIACPLACEPRHRSWFDGAGDDMLSRLEVSRVAADPAIVPAASIPGGWSGLRYHRLHGSPEVYRSEYGTAAMDGMRSTLALERERGAEAWCILDNTALGFATSDALELSDGSR
jgi:uncharacterized protein YecE (DUF72 family)